MSYAHRGTIVHDVLEAWYNKKYKNLEISGDAIQMIDEKEMQRYL